MARIFLSDQNSEFLPQRSRWLLLPCNGCVGATTRARYFFAACIRLTCHGHRHKQNGMIKIILGPLLSTTRNNTSFYQWWALFPRDDNLSSHLTSLVFHGRHVVSRNERDRRQARKSSPAGQEGERLGPTNHNPTNKRDEGERAVVIEQKLPTADNGNQIRYQYTVWQTTSQSSFIT